MVCADNVEELFLKVSAGSLALYTGVRVVEYTLFSGACRASIAASITADATGKLVLPECKTLVGAHCFKLLDLVETVRVKNVAFVADELVISNVLFGLTVYAALCENVCTANSLRLVIVESVNEEIFALCLDRGDTLACDLANTVDISHTVTGDTDSIYLFAVKAVLADELVEAVCIARLQEDKDLTLDLAGTAEKVLREVSSAEIAVNKSLGELIGSCEHSGSHIVIELTALPAENGGNCAVSEQGNCALA